MSYHGYEDAHDLVVDAVADVPIDSLDSAVQAAFDGDYFQLALLLVNQINRNQQEFAEEACPTGGDDQGGEAVNCEHWITDFKQRTQDMINGGTY